MTETFEGTGLDERILKAIDELSFHTPTDIQASTIPHLLSSKKDLIALAQTGTGKTAAFGLPIIHMTDAQLPFIQTLVLCPTRELCMQIAKDFESYSNYLSHIKTIPVYGGASIENQIKALKKGGHIVVGTPGRVLDLIRRKVLNISHIRWLVLDEADEMLNMGFKDELDAILATTPAGKQTLLFSATMPKELYSIANNYMDDPEQIKVSGQQIGAENIKHEYYLVPSRNKYLVLKRIADLYPNIYGIVFCRTRQETKEIADKLIHDGYNADALHGDLSQSQRDFVMNRFRKRNLQILVATDVAARGLDVNDLTHVINFHLPDDAEIYIHRSGRTGRAGKSGISISIIHSREVGKLRSIEALLKKKMEQKKVPSGQEICEKQLFNLIDKVEKVEVNEAQIAQYLPLIFKKLDWLSREDLIKHFVSVEFNRFLAYYKDAEDLNTSTSAREDKYNKTSVALSRFFINIGSKQQLTKKSMLGLINEHLSQRNVEIGNIEIMKNFSFFEVDARYEKEVLKVFNKLTVDGIPVFVEVAKEKSKSNKGYRDKKKQRGKKRR